MAKKKKNSKGGSGFFWKLIFLIALGVFCFSGYQLFTIYEGYKAGVDEYQEVAKEAVVKTSKPLVATDIRKDEMGELLAPELPDYDPPEVDFEELQAMNPDVIGWLEVEAIPDISYPIVQGEDNDYYLHRTFRRADNFAGSIFADYSNDRNFSDCNTIIYGHNMKNGSMFGKLKQLYESEKYKISKYIWICTPQAKYRYEIFSLQHARVNSETYTLFEAHDEQFADYLNSMLQKSEVDLKTEDLNQNDFIITLSTCTSNESVRFVVQARWVATY